MRYTIKDLDDSIFYLLEKFHGRASAVAMTEGMRFSRGRLLSAVAEDCFVRRFENYETEVVREAIMALNNSGEIKWEKE